MPLTLATICSGIGAPEVALHALGWRSLWASQHDPEHDYSRGPDFPSAVLSHRFPGLHNHGDFTQLIGTPPASPDVLIGGTPCQAFSVAGLRGGLADPRGGLTLAFVSLVGVLRPRWIVWENVPGVLSSDSGCAFGSLLSGLGLLGYGWAYRVLDAQYFGLAQRRKRVFVVAHSGGDWRRSAAVLFEPEGVCWDSPPRREEGVQPARDATSGLDGDRCARALTAHSARIDPETETLIAATLLAREGPSYWPDMETYVPDSASLNVRRLTPREMERLQGFSDNFTAIPWRNKPAEECPDGPRAKALGNSMAVPVLRWLGRRIEAVDAL